MGFIPHKSNHHSGILAGIGLCFIYGYLAYFTVRSEFALLISLTGSAFLICFYLVKFSDVSYRQLFGLAIVYRLIFLVAVPQLSQDFFRFFWDGQLVLNGINPYLYNVDSFFSTDQINSIHQANILRAGMGDLNAGNYSNYPPLSQLLYMLSAWVAKESVMLFIISLRLILMAFDFLFIYFAKRITEYFNKNPRVIFLYALNPLSMMEITGNLHLEGVMIALFAGSIYFLIKKQYVIAGALLSLSVGTKLLSLLVLPLLVIFIWRKYNPPKRYKPLIMLLASFVLVLSIQLLPFFSWSFINNFSESVGLWFGKFEFNASIFYIVRWVGYQVYGYNIIQSYGFYMPMLSIAFFILIMLRMKASIISVLESFLWMLTFYFLLSTTIHPWYILFPLALSVFTKFRYGMLWSFLVFLSYHAYSSEEFHEIYAIIFLEYAVLITVMLYEFRDRILSFRFSRKPKP